MTMHSYAQNAEDVVLARAFADRPTGFFVDIGAGHPVLDSVTKHFYDLGWRGINVEPLQEACELFRHERPEDVTIPVALSDEPGELVLHVGPPENRGATTLAADIADEYRSRGEAFEARVVPVTTLGTVLDEHVSGEIDFLKLDVEGYEAKVLAGVDLTVWRPRILVIEATRPNSTERSEHTWEPLVLKAGYRFALFDGLNRFYVRDEDADLVDRLGAPANVFDDFVPHRLQHEIDGLREQLDATTLALHDADGSYRRLEEARAETEDYGRAKVERIRELEAELHDAQDEAGRLHDEVARLQDAAQAARDVSAQEAAGRIEATRARKEAERSQAEALRERDSLARVRSELEHRLRVCEQQHHALSMLATTRTFRYTAAPRRAYGWARRYLRQRRR